MNSFLLLAALATTNSLDLQSVLDRLRIEQEVPGISAVVTKGDQILFAGGSGLADIESQRPMTADTVVYAGSLTKIMTAVLTLRLSEEGALSLDDIVGDIATDSRKSGSNIRVHHLLTHEAGLVREGDFGYWFNADFPDRSELRRYLLDTELRTQPGTSHSYSNIGFAALGLALESASGQNYDEALSDRVLEPLRMDSSGALAPGGDLAAGYSPVNRVLPDETRPFAGLGRRVGNRTIREYHNANAMTPAFGAFTNARDLSRLARYLLGFGNAGVLSDDLRLKMLTPRESGWGLGIRVRQYQGRQVARHGGWFAAHQTHMFLDLETGVGVVVTTNSDSASPGKIAEAIFKQTQQKKRK